MKAPSIIVITAVLFLQNFSLFSQSEAIQLGDFKGDSYDLQFFNNAQKVATAMGSDIAIFNLSNYSLEKKLSHHSNMILSFHLDESTSLLASSGRDSTINLWNINSGDLLNSLDYHKAVITSICLRNDIIISAGTDNKILIYNWKQRKVVKELIAHTDHILKIDLSPNKELLASCGADGKLIVWDLNTLKIIAQIENRDWIRAIDFSEDSKKVFYGDDSGYLKRFDLMNKEVYKIGKYSSSWITDILYRQESNMLISGSINGKIALKNSFAEYHYNMKAAIYSIQIIESESGQLKVIVGTLSKGVRIVALSDMTMN